jgi:hypothetical protein
VKVSVHNQVTLYFGPFITAADQARNTWQNKQLILSLRRKEKENISRCPTNSFGTIPPMIKRPISGSHFLKVPLSPNSSIPGTKPLIYKSLWSIQQLGYSKISKYNIVFSHLTGLSTQVANRFHNIRRMYFGNKIEMRS